MNQQPPILIDNTVEGKNISFAVIWNQHEMKNHRCLLLKTLKELQIISSNGFEP